MSKIDNWTKYGDRTTMRYHCGLLMIFFTVANGCAHSASGSSAKKSPTAVTKTRSPSPVRSPKSAPLARTSQPPPTAESISKEQKKSQKPSLIAKAKPRDRTTDGFPEARLQLCPRMRVSNAPASNKERYVRGFRPFVVVNKKVRIAVVPTIGACLSSGFGRRKNRLHKGVDFYSKPPSMIRAAADGVIMEAGYRKDYGNYVLIDHGHQVFTRYAHLQRRRPGIKAGASVRLGQALGKMGNTAGWKLPIHLHYELLVGDYRTPKKSFGLTPKDIFAYPYSSGGTITKNLP